jgi:hypothetical protein
LSQLVCDYLDELSASLGGIAPPIDPAVLQTLYDRRDHAAMLGWIKNSMRLELRVGLRIVERPRTPTPMWVELPQPMPALGSPAFRGLRVVVNARSEELLRRSFVWVVAGFAHELAHVVLAALGHRLQHDERAVDLAAMALGYQAFVGDAEVTRRVGLGWSMLITALLLPFGFVVWAGPARQTLRLGYLTRGEAEVARRYLATGMRPARR